jgi:predicted O-methyltransferase YrrM
MKPLQLLSLLPRRPREFYDRASAIATSRWEAAHGQRVAYCAVPFGEALQDLFAVLRSDFAGYVSEPSLSQIERQVEAGKFSLSIGGPFAMSHNADSVLARVCYVLARALRPKLAVETGVCYGVSSAYVLKALEANGGGHLHSIDLPPLGKDAERHVGGLIPEELRSRWTLHRGMSGRVLTPLLAKLGGIDLFIHDSLHTYRTMSEEFAVAWPSLRPGGVLISDDVEGNAAFLELMRRSDVARAVVVQEEDKDSLLGVAVKRG